MNQSFTTKSKIKELFESGGFAVRKRWGQNFLIDGNTIRKIVGHILEGLENLEDPDTVILEIGPGTGAITGELLSARRRVVAIERDPFLAESLRHNFNEEEEARAAVIQGDAREYLEDPSQLSGGELSEKTLEFRSISIVCGNLPYYLTTELILGALGFPGLKRGVFLVQREFARRVVAPTAESSITVYLQNRGDWEEVETIPPGCFYPAPEVHSSLIRFVPYEAGPICDPTRLEKILRMSYRGKRKKIGNSWKMGQSLIDLTVLQSGAASLGLDTNLRPENWKREDYYKLCNQIQG